MSSPVSHSPFPQQFGTSGTLRQPPRGLQVSVVQALPSSHIKFWQIVGLGVGGGVVGLGVGNGVPDPAAVTALNELILPYAVFHCPWIPTLSVDDLRMVSTSLGVSDPFADQNQRDESCDEGAAERRARHGSVTAAGVGGPHRAPRR